MGIGVDETSPGPLWIGMAGVRLICRMQMQQLLRQESHLNMFVALVPQSAMVSYPLFDSRKGKPATVQLKEEKARIANLVRLGSIMVACRCGGGGPQRQLPDLSVTAMHQDPFTGAH